MTQVDQLMPGEVGCVIASMKDVKDTRVGDTITHAQRPAAEPLPGISRLNLWFTAGYIQLTMSSMWNLEKHWKNCS